MPYFKDMAGGLHFLSVEDVANGAESLLPSGCTLVSDADAEAIQNPPLPPEQIVALYMAAIQKALDAGAQSWGYDDLRAAVSYVGDPYPRFNAEAVALRGWRSAVWVWVGMEEAAIKAGQKALPTPVEQFVAQMPALPARPV